MEIKWDQIGRMPKPRTVLRPPDCTLLCRCIQFHQRQGMAAWLDCLSLQSPIWPFKMEIDEWWHTGHVPRPIVAYIRDVSTTLQFLICWFPICRYELDENCPGLSRELILERRAFFWEVFLLIWGSSFSASLCASALRRFLAMALFCWSRFHRRFHREVFEGQRNRSKTDAWINGLNCNFTVWSLLGPHIVTLIRAEVSSCGTKFASGTSTL